MQTWPSFKKKRLLGICLVIFLIVAFLTGYQLGWMQARNSSITIEPGSFTEESAFIIFKINNMVYAKNGKTGEIDFQDIDIKVILTSCINALSRRGGIIFIKAGKYVTEGNIQIINKSNFQIIGEGKTSTIIEIPEPTEYIKTRILDLQSCENFIIKDLWLQGNCTSHPGEYRPWHGLNLENCENFLLENLKVTRIYTCIACSGKKGIISGCEVHGLYGTEWVAQTGIIISGNSEDFIIENCYVHHCAGDLILPTPQVGMIRRLFFIGNVLDSCGDTAIDFAGVDRSKYIEGATVIGNLFRNCHHSHIVQTYSRAITIANNIYDEGDQYNSHILITGSAFNVVIKGNVFYDSGVFWKYSIRLGNGAHDITIEGNVFTRPSGTNGAVYFESTSLPAKNINIIGNIFQGNASGGYLVCFKSYARGEKIVVSNNIITEVASSTGFMWFDDNSYVADMLIIGNTFNSSQGMAFRGRGNYTLIGVKVYYNIFDCPSWGEVGFENFDLEGNSQFISENCGVASELANGGMIVHGLIGAPSVVALTCLNATYDGVPVTVSWNQELTNSTHIAVNIYWANGTAVMDPVIAVSWYAEV